MSLDVVLVLAIIGFSLLLFILEWLRPDMIALAVLFALMLFKLIEPGQALAGFASPAVAIVVSMLVVSAGLARTGLIDWLARRIDKVAGRGEWRLVFVLCLIMSILSAFLVNTAVVAVFIPVVVLLAKSRKISPSKVLIPLSFASQFGGVSTVIGTSSNIITNSIAIKSGLPGFKLFEFAPLGMIMIAIGTAYLVLVGRFLLPKRQVAESEDKQRLADYLSELTVQENSSLIGKSWQKKKAGVAVDLIKIIRDGKPTWRASKTKIRAGDILLMHGSVDDLIKCRDAYKLSMHDKEDAESAEIPNSDKLRLVEVLLAPKSRFVNRLLRTDEFTERYGGIIIGIQRRGKVINERLDGLRLRSGDTLLVQCAEEHVSNLLNSSNLIVTNELTELHLRTDRALLSLTIVVAMVVLAANQILPLVTASMGAAITMVLGRCLTLEEAYESIDWRVVFLLGGMIPLGIAMQYTGTAAWLTQHAFSVVVGQGPLVCLAALYLVTAILTEMMSNNATVVLLAPIGISLSLQLGVDPKPMLVAITFAAATSFASPIGYQTNTMVYSPGGYKFMDYAKVGLPLNVIFWGVSVYFIPIFWPF